MKQKTLFAGHVPPVAKIFLNVDVIPDLDKALTAILNPRNEYTVFVVGHSEPQADPKMSALSQLDFLQKVTDAHMSNRQTLSHLQEVHIVPNETTADRVIVNLWNMFAEDTKMPTASVLESSEKI